jgi:hypothetical protein
MNYEKDIQIEDQSLDWECTQQPVLMMRYTNHFALMRKLADESEEALDVIKAQIEKEIRDDPEAFDIVKITEAAVKAGILLDKRYTTANKAYINAKYEAKMAEGAVKAFDNRKDMIEGLIKLHGQQYFAGPATPHDLTKIREEKTKERNAGVAAKLQRNK